MNFKKVKQFEPLLEYRGPFKPLMTQEEQDYHDEMTEFMGKQGYGSYAVLFSKYGLHLTSDRDVIAFINARDGFITINRHLVSKRQVSTFLRHEMLHQYLKHLDRKMKYLGLHDLVDNASLHELSNIAGDYDISNQSHTESDKANMRAMQRRMPGEDLEILTGLVTEDDHPDWVDLTFEEMFDKLIQNPPAKPQMDNSADGGDEGQDDQDSESQDGSSSGQSNGQSNKKSKSSRSPQLGDTGDEKTQELEKQQRRAQLAKEKAQDASDDADNKLDKAQKDAQKAQEKLDKALADGDKEAEEEARKELEDAKKREQEAKDQKEAAEKAKQDAEKAKEIAQEAGDSVGEEGEYKDYDLTPEEQKIVDAAIGEIRDLLDSSIQLDKLMADDINAKQKETYRKLKPASDKYRANPLREFVNSLNGFIAKQIAYGREDTWKKPNPTFMNTNVIRPGRGMVMKSKVPLIQFYYDRSGSWDDAQMQAVGKRGAAVLQKYVDAGQIKLETWYFDTELHEKDPGCTGGTSAIPIMEHIQETKPDNVVIVTDADTTNQILPHAEVPGGVWFLWVGHREHNHSEALRKSLRGRMLTREYEVNLNKVKVI